MSLDLIGFYTYNGTQLDDKISTLDIKVSNPSYDHVEVLGNGGDDFLVSSIVGKPRIDVLRGGDGNDMLGAISLGDGGYVNAIGDHGTDRFTAEIPDGTSPVFSYDTDYHFIQFTIPSINGSGDPLNASVSNDVEIIDLAGKMYLTEDIVKGIARVADWDEVYFRAYGSNSDWYLHGRDTYSEWLAKQSGQVHSSSPDLLTGYIVREANGLPATFEMSESFDVTGVIKMKTKNGKTKKKSITRSVDRGFLVGTETIDGFVSRFSVYADFDRSGTFNKKSDKVIGSGEVALQHLGLYESLPVGSRSWGLEFGGAFAITYANEVVATGTHFL